MTVSTRSVREHLAALGAWDGVDVARMPADEAMDAFQAGALALHALQAVVSRFAARVDVVCEQSPGMNGYARRHGYASAPALLAARSGMAPGEVNRMADLGRGLLAADAGAERAQREAFDAQPVDALPLVAMPLDALPLDDMPLDDEPLDDEPLGAAQPPLPRLAPAELPRELAPGEYLAREVDAGRVGPAHAEVIRLTLADFTIDSRAAEREFVDYSRHVGLRKLKAHCFWRLGELDPEGLAIREARQRRDRFVSITEGPDGMLTFFGKLDVVTGAPIKTLLDSMGASAMRRQRKLSKEERFTPGQLMADALSDVSSHALTCQNVPRRVKTTVVVRLDNGDVIDDLRDAGLVDERGIPTAQGRGLASCDGILQPITAGTARLMAVEAQILPAVMGGDSLPLDLGRSKRLFTKEQTLAIIERDRGCIRCTAPPAFCHTHHVIFWSDDGPTDASNGVLLCAGCHHRLHEQRWTLEFSGDRYVVQEHDVNLERGRGRDPDRQPTCPDRHPLNPVA